MKIAWLLYLITLSSISGLFLIEKESGISLLGFSFINLFNKSDTSKWIEQVSSSYWFYSLSNENVSSKNKRHCRSLFSSNTQNVKWRYFMKLNTTINFNFCCCFLDSVSSLSKYSRIEQVKFEGDSFWKV